jgi:transposase
MDARNLSADILNERRRQAVKLRLAGMTVAAVSDAVELSAPTVIAAHKAYLAGGWSAVLLKRRGRVSGSGRKLDATVEQRLLAAMLEHLPDALGLPCRLWSDEAVAAWFEQQRITVPPRRSLARYRTGWGVQPMLSADDEATLREQLRITSKCDPWWTGAMPWHPSTLSPGSQWLLFARGRRGQLHWMVCPHTPLTHLQRLEAESIHIMREVVAECRQAGDALLDRQGQRGDAAPGDARPSTRRRRRFRCCTSTPPGSSARCTSFATAWRESWAWNCSCTSIPDGLAKGINPFDHGSAMHTDIMKTEGLKQALDKYGFDAAFGGARRDEEKSPRQGAHLLVPQRAASLGPEEPAPRALEASTTRASTRARASACSRSRTGPSSTSGSTSTSRTSRSCRSTSPPSAGGARDGTLIMVDDERMPLRPARCRR